MVRHKHKEFLKDAAHYNSAVCYWRTLCEAILRRHGQVDFWQPWCGIHQKDVLPHIEEGSIFSLHSAQQGKAFNIEQYSPKSILPEVTARLDTFGEGVLEEPIQYLTICCSISEEAESIVIRLLDHWIRPDTTTAQMQEVIDRIIE